MKYHLQLKSGKWIGGFTTTRADLALSIEMVRKQTVSWNETVIATRVDKKGRGQVIVIEPDTELALNIRDENLAPCHPGGTTGGSTNRGSEYGPVQRRRPGGLSVHPAKK